jgi:protein-tyrosine kinase
MGKIFNALEKTKFESRMVSPERFEAGAKTKQQVVNRDDEGAKTKVSSIYSSPDRSLISLLDPKSFEAEQFKALRTSILFPGTGKPPRVTMVTSAVPGEGKSFVASNLAVSIAQNIDDHVLLIDCDLRLPTIHKVFGITQNRGLSEYLSGEMELTPLFVKTGINKLSILPGGNPPANPSELLSSDQMANLIKEVRTRYNDRYIILDSAPPLLASESNALVKHTDGILLVVNCGSTDRDAIIELTDIFKKDKMLGVVFNRFDIRASSYFRYGKYGKYHKYYK